MSIYYIDGEFVDENDALIPATDLAVLRGYGVFDFTRSYGGVPFKLAEHVTRLRRSAEHIELSLPFSEEEIADIVMQTVKRNNYPECTVRIVITGGAAGDDDPHRALWIIVTLYGLHHDVGDLLFGERQRQLDMLGGAPQTRNVLGKLERNAAVAAREIEHAVTTQHRQVGRWDERVVLVNEFAVNIVDTHVLDSPVLVSQL